MPRTAIQDAEQRGTEQRVMLRAARPRPAESYQTSRDRLASAASARRAFTAVLSSPCTRHRARAGRGCWEVPSGIVLTGGATYPAICGDRIASVFAEVTR